MVDGFEKMNAVELNEADLENVTGGLLQNAILTKESRVANDLLLDNKNKAKASVLQNAKKTRKISGGNDSTLC